MATYLIGDIHGCYREFRALLDKAGFDPANDKLWSVGDLIGRGPQALETLEFCVSLGDSFSCVLGNHDLHALAGLCETRKYNPKDRTEDLMASPDKDFWIDWLRNQPLLLSDTDTETVVVHAGIYPGWSIEQAQALASEAENVLRSEHFLSYVKDMYGNEPAIWQDNLEGVDRWRFIINSLTRMRYCTPDGRLDLNWKEPPSEPAPDNLKPWFELANPGNHTVVFGHWASLMGETHSPQFIGLDTGCVWGQKLRLMELKSRQFIEQPAL